LDGFSVCRYQTLRGDRHGDPYSADLFQRLVAVLQQHDSRPVVKPHHQSVLRVE